MSRAIDLLEKINNYSFSGNEEKILDILNDLFDSGEYKLYLEIVFMAISITEMYGFLAYLEENEREKFIEYDFRSDTYQGKRINYYNRGQLSLLLDFDKYKKVFLSAPTSFGKTSLVLEYIITKFNKLKNVLFIVPTNSLLEELYMKIMNLNKKYSMRYDVSTQPYYDENKNNFLIITPERFLLMQEEVDVNNFDLIVLDETYKIVDSKNEKISDFIESRALRFRKVADIIGNTSKKLILLSPFTYKLTESMEKYLTKYGIKKIDRTLEYVNREIYKIDDSQNYKKYFNCNAVGYTKKSSISNKCNLILKRVENQKNIIYVSQYSKAYELIDGLQWMRKLEITDRYAKFLDHLEKNYSIYENHEWKIITALKKGVGIYISPLPRYIKRELIRLYEENVLGTLIVNTAFTEGVNTDACNLIFTSLSNGPSANKLSDIDVLNVSGRAGRFAKNSIGKIFCITEEVFERVNKLQEKSIIELENYNYKSKNNHIDYEIDMIDEEYLSEDDKKQKEEIEKMAENLGLTLKDLKISLNVSNKWKLNLYKYFNDETDEKLEKLYDASVNLLSAQPSNRVSSLETIFESLKKSFEIGQIDGFKCQPFEIRAYNDEKFTWGRLYKIYSIGSTNEIIKNNMAFIIKQFEIVIKKYSLQNAKDKSNVEWAFANDYKKWILNYYNSDLSINYDAFYSETFKFISSVIQYKIPFYTSFFVSVLRLYMMKNDRCSKYDINQLDAKKISLLFEDGGIYDDYSKMIDYGISNDLIIKLNEQEISVNQIKENSYDKSKFDKYELLLLEEFSKII